MKKASSYLLPSLQSIVDGICGIADIPLRTNSPSSVEHLDYPSNSEGTEGIASLPTFSTLNKPNRYNIAGPNNIQTLTVPITQDDKHNPITQVRINYNENWIRDHKHAWQTAYGKSPFFEYYDYRFWSILDAQPVTLADLLNPWNQLLFAQLGMNLFETTSKETQQNITQIKPYPQVFDVKFGFRSEVSGIDLLFNQGPLAKEYLSQYLPTNTIFAS
ncbi:MAG: WbqC family protein [Bacteroidetes bacterium]|nr:WbqC family protein [Bacteroidota bacterium]MDA1224007.1 WbqC family protein [Bacteroidota bacterium]